MQRHTRAVTGTLSLLLLGLGCSVTTTTTREEPAPGGGLSETKHEVQVKPAMPHIDKE